MILNHLRDSPFYAFFKMILPINIAIIVGINQANPKLANGMKLKSKTFISAKIPKTREV